MSECIGLCWQLEENEIWGKVEEELWESERYVVVEPIGRGLMKLQEELKSTRDIDELELFCEIEVG